jgi:hypothetical protein
MLNKETQGAKRGEASPRSASTNRDKALNKSEIHPNVNEELRKLKPWLTQKEMLTLETEGKPIPNRVLDCLEAMLLHHLAATDDYTMFLANHRLMTDAVDAGTEMNKSDLFHAIR